MWNATKLVRGPFPGHVVPYGVDPRRGPPRLHAALPWPNRHNKSCRARIPYSLEEDRQAVRQVGVDDGHALDGGHVGGGEVHGCPQQGGQQRHNPHRRDGGLCVMGGAAGGIWVLGTVWVSSYRYTGAGLAGGYGVHVRRGLASSAMAHTATIRPLGTRREGDRNGCGRTGRWCHGMRAFAPHAVYWVCTSRSVVLKRTWAAVTVGQVHQGAAKAPVRMRPLHPPAYASPPA